MNIGRIENHTEREKGVIVYPVYSRRSKGLSIGINLFPDRKLCSFNCPYCEVFPFASDLNFSLPLMEAALIERIAEAGKMSVEIKDICFSGNGEPSLSPFLSSALDAAFKIRERYAPQSSLVLITNGTGLLDEAVFNLLADAALRENGLNIWLKLDAATPCWYKSINCSEVPFGLLLERIHAFVKRAPVTLQTMICAVNGSPPPPDETSAWVKMTAELAASAAKLIAVQIYGKARPAPEDPLAEALPRSFLEEKATLLRSAIAANNKDTLIEVYP